MAQPMPLSVPHLHDDNRGMLSTASFAVATSGVGLTLICVAVLPLWAPGVVVGQASLVVHGVGLLYLCVREFVCAVTAHHGRGDAMLQYLRALCPSRVSLPLYGSCCSPPSSPRVGILVQCTLGVVYVFVVASLVLEYGHSMLDDDDTPAAAIDSSSTTADVALVGSTVHAALIGLSVLAIQCLAFLVHRRGLLCYGDGVPRGGGVDDGRSFGQSGGGRIVMGSGLSSLLPWSRGRRRAVPGPNNSNDDATLVVGIPFLLTMCAVCVASWTGFYRVDVMLATVVAVFGIANIVRYVRPVVWMLADGDASQLSRTVSEGLVRLEREVLLVRGVLQVRRWSTVVVYGSSAVLASTADVCGVQLHCVVRVSANNLGHDDVAVVGRAVKQTILATTALGGTRVISAFVDVEHGGGATDAASNRCGRLSGPTRQHERASPVCDDDGGVHHNHSHAHGSGGCSHGHGHAHGSGGCSHGHGHDV